MLVLSVILAVVACSSPQPDGGRARCRDLVIQHVGPSLVRAPELGDQSRPDLFLTAMADDLLDLRSSGRLPADYDLALDSVKLPEPWFSWSLTRVLSAGGPVQLPPGQPYPHPAGSAGDPDAASVELWAWADGAQRLTTRPHDWGQAIALGRRIEARGVTSWYAAWRLQSARTILDLPPLTLEDPRIPAPTRETADLPLELLGYLSIKDRGPKDPAVQIIRDLPWQAAPSGLDSYARVSLLRFDGRQSEFLRERSPCRGSGAEGFALQRPIVLGSTKTTFIASSLLGDSFKGVLPEEGFTTLRRDLASGTMIGKLQRLESIALLKRGGRPVDSYRSEIDAAKREIGKSFSLRATPEAVSMVSSLRAIDGEIARPRLDISGDPPQGDAGLFVLANADCFSNTTELVKWLSPLKPYLWSRLAHPDGSRGYYLALQAVVQAAPEGLTEAKRAEIAAGVASLKGCERSPDLYRVSSEGGQGLCSFEATWMVLSASFGDLS